MQLMSILFTSNPLVGHWLPMLPLARAAQRAGHEVAVAAGPDAVAEVERRGFTAWSVGWDFQTVWAGMLTRPRGSRNCDRQAMLRLPAMPPLTGWRHSTRLPRGSLRS